MKNQTTLRNAFVSILLFLTSSILLSRITEAAVLRSNERPFSQLQPRFVTIDVPGAVNGSYAQAINGEGVIAGTYVDENFAFHGFVRAQDGSITAFDAPGGIITQTGGGSLVAPAAINASGAVTGSYFDENFLSHGFVRAADGTLTTFDVRGAVSTNAKAINPLGVVTGYYYDANNVPHGFVRMPNGRSIAFDAPGAAFGTQPLGLNVKGAIIGQFFDGNFPAHGFVRAPDGSFVAFDPPGATYTEPNDINAAGMITGSYHDENYVFHGFVRVNGSIITFDVPGAGTGSFQGTNAAAIDHGGTVTGYYIDANGMVHGFIRARNGAITPFDAPDSTSTLSLAISTRGLVTGIFFDSDGVPRAFLRMP